MISAPRRAGRPCYAAAARERGPWSIYLGEHRRGEEAPSWLRRWKGDGVIARIENRQIARVLGGVKVPVVDVSAGRYLPRVPYVETDDRAIAELGHYESIVEVVQAMQTFVHGAGTFNQNSTGQSIFFRVG